MSRRAAKKWRSLTIADRFDIYADLFALMWEERAVSGLTSRVEELSWCEKVVARQKAVNAFALLDKLRCDRATSDGR